jgi:hypothetical protein
MRACQEADGNFRQFPGVTGMLPRAIWMFQDRDAMPARRISANIKAAAETSLGEAAIDFDGGLYHPRHLLGAVMTVPSGPLIIAMQKACHLEII